MINQMLQDCIQDLRTIGIPVSNDIDKEVLIKDVTGYAGCCKMERRRFTISLSKYILHDKETIKDVLYHELIHTCPKCQNHGLLFKQYMKRANILLNAHIVTKFDMAMIKECGIMDAKIKKSKYRIYCPNCGTLAYRERKSPVIKAPQHYHCNKCHSHIAVEVLHA